MSKCLAPPISLFQVILVVYNAFILANVGCIRLITVYGFQNLLSQQPRYGVAALQEPPSAPFGTPKMSSFLGFFRMAKEAKPKANVRFVLTLPIAGAALKSCEPSPPVGLSPTTPSCLLKCSSPVISRNGLSL
ncbi:hypothetical protein ERJ75_000021700 [Trypanosoma vivax]|nr:hypothetical protein ERJ75_001020000 [Trypanosoma vivax]KAH8620848.1 hypothetical protein ERJ75_000021700 [Trypanosoma vivax]